jgi:23S rRNA (guanosine2251-2'-O)-methyltransferase
MKDETKGKEDNSYKAYKDRQEEKQKFYKNRDKEGKGKTNRFKSKRDDQESNEDYVVGIHPVMEALGGDRSINRIMIERDKRSKPIHEIIVAAKEKGIVIQEVDKNKLSQVAGSEVHQGVVAYVSPYNYYELSDAIAELENDKNAIIVALDHLTDVHNFGSILRSCEAAGVGYVLIPQRRSVQVNSTVAKTSAGAIEHVKVIRVNSLTNAIETLKASGYWVIGADMDGEKRYDAMNYDGKLVLVAGSEGDGMGRHIKKLCDHIVHIPMVGKVNSLNVSVATSLLVYEWRRHVDATHN